MEPLCDSGDCAEFSRNICAEGFQTFYVQVYRPLPYCASSGQEDLSLPESGEHSTDQIVGRSQFFCQFHHDFACVDSGCIYARSAGCLVEFDVCAEFLQYFQQNTHVVYTWQVLYDTYVLCENSSGQYGYSSVFSSAYSSCTYEALPAVYD